MNRVWWLLPVILFIDAAYAPADTQGFFRIQATEETRVIGFDADGTIAWSNAVVGSTGKIQRSLVLPAVEESWTNAHFFTATTAVMAVRLPLEIVPAGMVLIPGGTNAGTDPDFGAYSLTVTPFYMDKHEVTKAQWDQVYAWAITNGYRFDAAGSGVAPNHPVQQVIWYDCVKWCNARSQKEGRPVVYTVNGAVYKAGRSNDVVQAPVAGYRLPTSVEWEYAARGGATGRRFPWSNSDEIQHDRANYNSLPGVEYDTSPSKGWHPAYNDGSTPYTSPVGSFAQNGYGLYDMAGNVWEWCFDWQPNWVGTFRSFRGGSWDDFAGQSRVGFRPTGAPNPILYNVGFRVVLTLNP